MRDITYCILIALLAGCSAPATTPATTPATALASGAGATASPIPTATPQPEARNWDLPAIALTLDDMPSGWAAEEDDDSPQDDSQGPTLPDYFRNHDLQLIQEYATTFEDATWFLAGPIFVISSLAEFESIEDATQLMAAGIDPFNYVFASDKTTEVKAISGAKLGEESSAYLSAYTEDDITIAMLFLMYRIENLVIFIISGALQAEAGAAISFAEEMAAIIESRAMQQSQ